MNGRRSLDPATAKPFNINIYYNINSKNITNNHQVQSHPTTTRINKTIFEDSLCNPYKNDTKPKSNKLRKKKYSVDLGILNDQRTQNMGKKSNNVSICSGFPSQTNNKNQNQKRAGDKKSTNSKKFEKSEKKLNQLLQIFSEGKIDKAKLTKQIIQIFQYKGGDEKKQRRVPKKKKSESTLIGTATPKNYQMTRFNSTTNNMRGVMNIHNVRKNQSKSSKSSFSNPNKQIDRSQIVKNIIQAKAINSSLCLQPDEDERILPIFIDRQNDVQTSQSIVLLNEHLNREKQRFQQIINQQTNKNLQNIMAIKIQRFWRKYKTKSLIKQLLKQKAQLYPTDPNSQLQKIQCVSGNSDVEVQAYLSQQLGKNNNVMKESEMAKVEQLREYELKKWNQIMDYVKVSIQNKSLSSGQCLIKIIDYFQNAKRTVQKQLQLETLKNKQKLPNKSIPQSIQSRQITQFTNKAYSKQIQNDQNRSSNLEMLEEEISSQQNQPEKYQQVEEQEKQKQKQKIDKLNDSIMSRSMSSLNSQRSNQRTYSHDEFQTMIKDKSDNLSFQIVEAALIKYFKKLNLQHLQKLKQLDIHSPNYLQRKKKLNQKYKQSKKQLKRIICNLNKGYMQAKFILEKQSICQSEESIKNSNHSNDRQLLQKCKSDNYLLKTAINYKQYIQRRQKKQTNENKNKINKISDSEENQKVLTKVRNKDNLQLKSGGSSELSDVSMVKKLKQVMDPQYDDIENKLENKSDPFQMHELQGGEGCITNTKQMKYNRLQQKIVSQEFLQYQQIHKAFDVDDQKQSNSIVSIDNRVSAGEISLFQNTKLNQMSRKLKYLTSQDKDDIFEFLFIDLTLELITEYDQDTQIYKTIKKYVQKRKRLESIPKGIKTNLQACKQYLSILSNTIMSDFSDIFQKHICVPMGPSAREMLKYMHDEDCNEDISQQQDLNVPLILPVTVFQKIQSKSLVEYSRYYDDDAKELPRIKFLKSVDHIHHKAVFDSLNQCLDSQRPYGIWGVPFPWKTTHKNSRKFDWEEKTRMTKLKRGIQKVIHCCSYMCGILSDKEDNMFNNHKVSEHYVEQIREDRMSKMLANQLLEGEDRWSFYDDEETEVIIELSRILTTSLISQFAEQFANKFSHHQ